MMYAVIRQYRINSDSRNELTQLIEEGLVPLLKEVPGFLAYYLLEAEEGMLATISVFEDQAGIDECAKVVEQWMKENLTTLFSFRPKNALDLSITAEGVLRTVAPESPNGQEETFHLEKREHLEGRDPLKLLSVEEVCDVLGMGKSWVYRKIQSAEIPSVRLGRTVKVSRQDLEEYLQNKRYRPEQDK